MQSEKEFPVKSSYHKAKGCRSVTLKDVAAKCGVSMVTVSAALRGDRRQVCEKTELKIRKIAARMGYDPSATAFARRLRYCTSSKRILNHVVGLGFAWDYINSPYFARLFEALGKELTKHGYSILTNWAMNAEDSRLPASFARGEVDGVFHVSGSKSDRLLDSLRREAGFGMRPVVSIFEKLPGCSNVLVDDYSGGRQIAEHLLRMGHRSWLYLESGNYQNDQRMRGMRDALEAAGLDGGALHPVFYNILSQGRSLASLKEQIEAFPESTAIYCANDANAVRIHNWLGEIGLRVPQDISIIGYDNTHEIHDRHGVNMLTTVEIPLEEAGRAAAELMVSRIEGREQEDRDVTLPVKLVARSSVAGSAAGLQDDDGCNRSQAAQTSIQANRVSGSDHLCAAADSFVGRKLK